MKGQIDGWYYNPFTRKLDYYAGGQNLKTWWNFEDFISPGYGGIFGIWQRYLNGAGADGVGVPPSITRPGQLMLYTGTTAIGYSSLLLGSPYANSFLFGGGVYTFEADLMPAQLSTPGDTFAVRVGFGDTYSGDNVDGAYFEYTDVGITPNWYRCTASNSVRTKIDTGIAVVPFPAWTRLKIVVNADGTLAEFFINGVSAGSNAANIPTGPGRETSAVMSFVKTVGINPMALYIDWAWLHIDLTTSR